MKTKKVAISLLVMVLLSGCSVNKIADAPADTIDTASVTALQVELESRQPGTQAEVIPSGTSLNVSILNVPTVTPVTVDMVKSVTGSVCDSGLKFQTVFFEFTTDSGEVVKTSAMFSQAGFPVAETPDGKVTVSYENLCA